MNESTRTQGVSESGECPVSIRYVACCAKPEDKWLRGKHRVTERFLNKVTKDQATGCWIWTGCTSSRGKYGKRGTFKFNKKSEYAYRASWILFRSEIPKGKVVCHSCDNPQCVNPDHLWVGTSKQNTHDSIRKGRFTRVNSFHADAHIKYGGGNV